MSSDFHLAAILRQRQAILVLQGQNNITSLAINDWIHCEASNLHHKSLQNDGQRLDVLFQIDPTAAERNFHAPLHSVFLLRLQGL